MKHLRSIFILTIVAVMMLSPGVSLGSVMTPRLSYEEFSSAADKSTVTDTVYAESKAVSEDSTQRYIVKYKESGKERNASKLLWQI